MEIQWSLPVWMWPLLLVVAAGAVVWTVAAYRQTRPHPGRRLWRTLVGLRVLALVLLVLAVAGPILSHLRQRTEPAQLAVVLEDSGSMELTDAGAGDGAASRWQKALSVAAGLDSVFAAGDREVDVVFLRGNGLDPLREFRLDDAVIPAPDRHGTSLASLVQQVRARFLGRPVRAVVLLSDGQETGRRDVPGGRARSGAERGLGGVPIHVAGVGDERGPADRVVKDLRFPDSAFQGDEVVVDFAVDHRFTTGETAEPLIVELSGPQGRVAVDTLTAGDGVVPVQLTFRPEEPGLHAYRLQVSPLDNERFLENNQATLAIDVRKDRARVLLLTSTLSWDVRFLAQAAAREPRLELAVVHPTPAGLVFADSLTPWRWPPEAAGWSGWDAVVLTDWTGAVGRRDWADLAAAVGGGLGLIVIPSASVSSGGPLGLPPPQDLAAVLPVAFDSWRWERGTFFASPRTDAAGHPVLDGVGAAAGPEAGLGLADLPPLRERAVTTTRPGNTELVVISDRVAGTQPRRLPLLVVGGHGEGRTAWFGGRHLWEWAFWEGNATVSRDGEQPGRRLLRNLLVWAAVGNDESGLAFSGRPTVYQEGEPIRLAAQWRDLRGRPVRDRQISVVVQGAAAGADTTERSFAMTSSSRSPGLSEVQLPALPPGTYTARLVGQGDPQVAGPQTNLIVTGTSVERTQVRLDRRRLEQLAAREGGAYGLVVSGVPPELLQSLLAQDWRGQELERRERLDALSGWPFLAVITLVLGCEWLLRRRHGLL